MSDSSLVGSECRNLCAASYVSSGNNYSQSQNGLQCIMKYSHQSHNNWCNFWAISTLHFGKGLSSYSLRESLLCCLPFFCSLQSQSQSIKSIKSSSLKPLLGTLKSQYLGFFDHPTVYINSVYWSTHDVEPRA
jgi:hypothetical protein